MTTEIETVLDSFTTLADKCRFISSERAALVGVSRMTLHQWKQGIRSPSPEALERIKKAITAMETAIAEEVLPQPSRIDLLNGIVQGPK